MRIILDTQISNSDLPLIDPLLQMNTSNCLCLYDMLSKIDITGKSIMGFDGVFGSTGATVTPTTFINTGITEQDEMTIIYCWNISNSGSPQQGIGNLSPSAAPYKGFRLTLTSSDPTSGRLTVASGVTSPESYFLSNTNFAGAWTVQAITISNTLMQKISHAGGVSSTAVGSREKSDQPIYLNGGPSASGMAITNGGSGVIGMFAAFNKVLDTTTIVSYMDIMQAQMASRGVTVP